MEVVVTADKAWYETVHVEGIVFPTGYADRRYLLTGDLVSIGRQSLRLGIYADIDLSVGSEDIGVSRQHALVWAGPDRAWSLVDRGSTNGTYLNDEHRPLPTNEAIPLGDGDRIHLGAWTTIIFHVPADGPVA